ncbi:MAG: hypothetical protein IKE61_03935 [Coriobacteriales bacterium]|nr:hypothetical protein [Coriobacteriales bacterium]
MAARKFDGSDVKGRFELTDEQLDAISGGVSFSSITRPNGLTLSKRCACGSRMILMKGSEGFFYRCPKCGQDLHVVAT